MSEESRYSVDIFEDFSSKILITIKHLSHSLPIICAKDNVC